MLNRGLAILQPRDYRAAARVVSIMSVVACTVSVIFAAVEPPNSDRASTAVTIVVDTVVALAGWRVRHVAVIHPSAWAVLPFVTIAVIVGLDYLTADGTVAAQVFFFFPVLYGANHLRRHGAAVVTAAAMIGEVAVVVRWLPVREALVSVGYVGAVIATTAVLLVLSQERQERLVEMLSQQAAVDPLTGLVTRRVLDKAAEAALSGATSHDGTALILLDVDRFKSINDEFGHPAGDEVLVQLARVLVDVCRPTDVISRLGGDEIALLLLGCSNAAMSDRAEQILDRVRAHSFAVNDLAHLYITVSAGLAHAPTHADHLRLLYSVADEALYRAKRSGRNQFAGPLTPSALKQTPPAPDLKDSPSLPAR